MVSFVDRVVELENAGVQRTGVGRGEGIRQKVISISLGSSVGHRERFEECLRGGVRSGRCTDSVVEARGIESRNLSCRQGVGRGFRAIRIARVDAVLIGYVALTISGTGHDSRLLLIFRRALPFIVEEEEELVFLDRASQRPSEGVRMSLPGWFGNPDCSSPCLLNQSFAYPRLLRLYS